MPFREGFVAVVVVFPNSVRFALKNCKRKKKGTEVQKEKKNTDCIYLKDFPNHAKLACDPTWPHLAGTGQRCLRVTWRS